MMTLHDLLETMEDSNRERRRDRHDTNLTASSVSAPCARRVAYSRCGAEPTDPRETPVGASTVGTLIHAAVAELWKEVSPDARVEQPTPVGTPDLVVPGEIVRDLKTLNSNRFDEWDAMGGPPDSTWWQLAVYADHLGHPDGSLLVIDALDRSNGRCATYEAVFDAELRRRAVEAFADMDHATRPDTVAENGWPARPRGIDASKFPCTWCEFFTLCWSDDAGTPPLPDPAAEEVETAAESWVKGTAMERAARNLKSAARPMLDAAAEGEYGRFRVRRTVRRTKERFVEASESVVLRVEPVED